MILRTIDEFNGISKPFSSATNKVTLPPIENTLATSLVGKFASYEKIVEHYDCYVGVFWLS